MLQMAHFNRDDPFPSWFANSVGKALSLLVSQFLLVQSDNTHVQLPAGADDAAAVLTIKGLWRWVEATITVAHPGGAAGVYPIFATAKNNNITNTPDPYTDNTDYSFALTIKGPGLTPAIVAGTVDVYRHVGDAVWDGAKITRVDQFAPQTPLHAARHAVGGPDAISPSSIGAVASGDAHTLQTGDIVFGAGTSRAGAVLCDGAAYSRTDPVYSALFVKIGTRFGAGDGSTTFNVPNYLDRQIIGASATHPLGSTGGAETMALSTGNLPGHFHGFSGITGVESVGHTHGSPSGAPFVTSFSAFTSDVYNNPQSGHTPGVYANSVGLESSTGGRSTTHTHGYSGNTDNGPGSSSAFSLRDPFGTANAFVLL